MKTYRSKIFASIFFIALMASAQEHPFLVKTWTSYPAAKPQNASTFSTMLAEKPQSKMNGVAPYQSVGENVLPIKPPSKTIVLPVNKPITPEAEENKDQFPKKPVSKMNDFERRLIN